MKKISFQAADLTNKSLIPIIAFLSLVFGYLGNALPPKALASQPGETGLYASYYAHDLSDKFQETEVFHLNGDEDVYGYFDSSNPYNAMHICGSSGCSYVPEVSVGNTFTLNAKEGIAIKIPSGLGPFYRIEATLVDTDQQDLSAYITLIDQLWAPGVLPKGVSVGIDTTQSIFTIPSKETYWYWHSDFQTTPGGGLTQANIDWSMERLNRFLRRTNGDIKFEIYVTPKGIYPVINGANFASFPNLYIGSYTYDPDRNEQSNYLVLGKWNNAGDTITFKNIRVVDLDDSITNIDEVNAHFIKKTYESDAFQDLVGELLPSGQQAVEADLLSALFSAFLYRGYDYYFKTDHTEEIQELVDEFLFVLPARIWDTTLGGHDLNDYASHGGTVPTIHVNHSLINDLSQVSLVLWGISASLRQDQLDEAKAHLEEVVDAIMDNTQLLTGRPGGQFPYGKYDQDDTKLFKGDSFADESAWIVTLLSGYYILFQDDVARIDRVEDYLQFYGFHHMSMNESIKDVFPDIIFNVLDDSYKNFVSQYVHTEGSSKWFLDNHNFHPSPGYASGSVASAVVSRNALLKGYGWTPASITANHNGVYLKSYYERMNPHTLRINQPVERWDPAGNTCGGVWSKCIQQDIYILTSGIPEEKYVVDFYGQTSPSLVEDWGKALTTFHVSENFADTPAEYNNAWAFAESAYYLYYTGSGKLFCGHTNTGCTVDTTSLWSFMFPDALYAMLFSQRSPYGPCEEPLTKTHIWSNPVSPLITWSCDQFTTPPEGKSSLKLHSPSLVTFERYSPLIPVEPNTTYEVRYNIKMSNLVREEDTAAYGKIMVAQYNATAQESDPVNASNRIDSGFNYGDNLSGTHPWTDKSYTITTRPNAAYVRLRAAFAVGGTGSARRAKGTVWFDGVKFIEPVDVLEASKTSDSVTHLWHAVNFQGSYNSAPVVITSMQTRDGGDTAGIRIRNLSATSMQIMCEEEQSKDTEIVHTTEVVGYLAMDSGGLLDSAGNLIGEAGITSAYVSNDSDWHTVTFQHAYQVPVVFMQISSYAGSHPAHIRLRNVKKNSFEYLIEEWAYLDGGHVRETLSYLVLEDGNHTLTGGVKLEVSRITLSDAFSTFTFSQHFDSDPIVISRSQTAMGGDPIVTRQRNILASSFQIQLQEEESRGPHTTEIVGYLAIEPSLSVSPKPDEVVRDSLPLAIEPSLSVSPKPDEVVRDSLPLAIEPSLSVSPRPDEVVRDSLPLAIEPSLSVSPRPDKVAGPDEVVRDSLPMLDNAPHLDVVDQDEVR